MAREEARIQLEFPVKGLSEDLAYDSQEPLTYRDGKNVRTYDIDYGRARGGTRGGLVRYIDGQANGSNRIQDIVKTTITCTAAAVSGSIQIRNIRALATCAGRVYRFDSGSYSAVDGGSAVLDNTVSVVFSTEYYNGDVYYADGTNEVYYNATNNAMETWTASAGSLPTSGSDKPRLIETWRGRLVSSGIKSDPHNWFMSAVEGAGDYDYAPSPETETQAIAGNNSLAGKVGDKINSIIPYSDDILLFGCDHSIWQMTGDPMAGGRVDQITNITGMTWGRGWCIDPKGVVYFMGSRGSFYRMVPGQPPERLSSNRIERQVTNRNLNTTLFSLAWSEEELGVYIYMTDLGTTGSGQEHFFWDSRANAFHLDRFETKDFDPFTVLAYDGDDSDDRVVLLGCNDGRIRYISTSSKKDDTQDLISSVLIGPIQIEKGEYPFVVKDIQMVFEGDDITYDILASDCAVNFSALGDNILTESGGDLLTEANEPILQEVASLVNAQFSGTFTQYRTKVHNPRVRGFAVYVRITTTNKRWALERIYMKLSQIMSSRGRRM